MTLYYSILKLSHDEMIDFLTNFVFDCMKPVIKSKKQQLKFHNELHGQVSKCMDRDLIDEFIQE